MKPTVVATDLTITIVNMLRKLGVVGKFVEFYGPGAASLTLADVAWFQFLIDYLDGGGWSGEVEAVAKVLPTVPSRHRRRAAATR